ncbi:hypothetical protein D9M71_491880 [compost metagenome]
MRLPLRSTRARDASSDWWKPRRLSSPVKASVMAWDSSWAWSWRTTDMSRAITTIERCRRGKGEDESATGRHSPPRVLRLASCRR